MMAGALVVERIRHMGREAVLLSNGLVEAISGLRGSMTPVFGIRRGPGFINAHWIPPFRTGDGVPYSETEHGRFWKSALLYELAGDFLCSPSFGPNCRVGGADIPPHGWTANEEWTIVGASADEAEGVAWVRYALESPAPGLPLTWERLDTVRAGELAYSSSVRIRNRGDRTVAVNMARHTTVGPPFLDSGCKISLCAGRFMTPPRKSEFSDTGRLAEGAEFEGLGEAPLRAGGRVDLGIVPGMIGYTDFVSGAIPRDLGLGWSCVANPSQGLAYVCFFPGAAGLPEGEIALGFNDLWMQYGGRPFTPWAESEGGRDRTFCLGTENAVGAFANGLAASLALPELLGRPTTVEIPPRGERTLHYGAALVELGKDLREETGAIGVDADGDGTLVLKGRRSSLRAAARVDFAAARRLL
jgi:hypothetical protein